jgi:endonuclease/exonuclease/phosphatase family metal-dependent hydrolase
MRLASFNVHAFTDRAGELTSSACIELLASLRADAIVLSEVPNHSSTLARVAGELGMYARLVPASSWLGNAFLGRVAPVSLQTLRLTAGQAETRSAFVADLGAVRFVGTHLDHLYEDTRLAQLEALLAALEHTPEPIVLAGDLNALTLDDYDDAARANIEKMRAEGDREAPLFDVTARLHARGWVDLWKAHGGTGALATCWAGTRVDYAFARGEVSVVSVEHVASSVSDHVPVVVELRSDL